MLDNVNHLKSWDKHGTASILGLSKRLLFSKYYYVYSKIDFFLHKYLYVFLFSYNFEIIVISVLCTVLYICSLQDVYITLTLLIKFKSLSK